METALLVIGIALVVLMVGLLVVGRNPGGRPIPPGGKRRARPPGSISGRLERERAITAQAEIEENDIAEMLEARNELRRRTGRPSLGDELADEARDEDERDAD